jgi:hypothetical protein
VITEASIRLTGWPRRINLLRFNAIEESLNAIGSTGHPAQDLCDYAERVG